MFGLSDGMTPPPQKYDGESPGTTGVVERS
jgi:hypothetical protein